MDVAAAIGRLKGVPPVWVDAGLAIALAAAMALTISVADEDGASGDPDALAYLTGAALGALLLARRRWPVGVLLGSVGVLLVYFGFDYPAVPLAAATYFAARAGHLLPAALLLLGVLAVGAGWRALEEGEPVLEILGAGALTDAALLAAVLLLGVTIRSRGAWAAEVRARLRREAEEREAQAARRVERERLRIARDLHDVVSHTIAALNVQAGVALDAIDHPGQAKESLRAVRAPSGSAMAELRRAVALLRDGAPASPAPPPPGSLTWARCSPPPAARDLDPGPCDGERLPHDHHGDAGDQGHPGDRDRRIRPAGRRLRESSVRVHGFFRSFVICGGDAGPPPPAAHRPRGLTSPTPAGVPDSPHRPPAARAPRAAAQSRRRSRRRAGHRTRRAAPGAAPGVGQ